MQTNQAKNTHAKIYCLVGVAIFSALAYVAMLFIHFKVSFLTLDPKDAIITLCGLCFGPVWALVSSLIVAVAELPVSSTGLYGLLMNFLGTAAFSVTVSLVYKWRKNFLSAILGLVSGVFAMTAVMLVADLFIIPLYTPGVDVSVVWNMIPKLLLPFNLVKGLFNASIVLLLYKPTVSTLRRIGFLPKSEAKLRFDARTILVMLAAILLIAASLFVIFGLLNGSFKFGI
ncbi:MAG: ECF transporter S component [Clostridia bacterium]|nr:ECF transporter S component [Clostridia bacterium]